MRNLHPLLQEYAKQVCRQVKARELRQEISEEIAGHLDELWESLRAQGLDDEAAARQAIAQMGDTDAVAQGLNRVHKPRVPWAMLSVLTLLLGIALLSMYAVQLSYKAGTGRMSDLNPFDRQAFHMVLGLAALFALSRIHYRKLLKYSWTLYGITIVILLGEHLSGQQANGGWFNLGLGVLGLDITVLSPYLFTIAAAGVLSRGYENGRAALRQLVVFGIIPLLLFALIPSFVNLVLYAATFALMLCFSGYGRRWVMAYLSLVTAIFLLPALLSGYGQDRLIGFLWRYRDADGSGYTYTKIDEAIRSAGWRGHGFGLQMDWLPYIHTDHIFTYLVYSLGWMFGAFVLFSFLFFIFHLMKAGLAIKESYGKMLITGLGALFAIQFFWSIGMSLGILPISAVSFPLFSYGGSGLLAQLAAIGLIYSVYRRKDMMRVR
ncbi:FtsW/RodA/SpoVE family cell cycle protein [Paenibacillus macerans]|uniref:FtsW/RodA/SpoVE family cell cycle protein n=1 Tax=Paenibacillus macerans TaxID=44252 RepID=UPI00203AC584|nr:FtsW/RodA/SpoVE family cell cycle protein [Paenibacillus macerans]MCM3703892.1 FtsW/RodA/SpoVE family cell cycle protein [Paenibacillus macerans]